MFDSLLGIPSVGWIAIGIWLLVNILPWTYSLYFINQINKSGVERWGAEK
jgi:hypothetical protein